jgi:hypothetical protein
MNGFAKIMKEMLDHALQWQTREWGGREREREIERSGFCTLLPLPQTYNKLTKFCMDSKRRKLGITCVNS